MARGRRLFEAWRGRTSAANPPVRRGDIGPLGVEFGRDRLRLVQLERCGDDVVLRALASEPLSWESELPAPEALRDVLKRALCSAPFRGRRVVTTLPGARTKLMVVNFDLEEDGDLDAQIARLVQERIDEPIEGFVVDYRPIRMDEEHRGSRAALVAVARKDEVVEFLELLRSAGLEVEALDIVPLAIHRLVSWLARREVDRHSLVLHCGRRRTHVLGLAGRRLVLYRQVDFGEADVVEALGKELDLGTDEARVVLERYGVDPEATAPSPGDDASRADEIAGTLGEVLRPTFSILREEVERAAVYTASQWRGAQIESAGLLGAFTRWNGIDRLIEGLVSIPTHRLDPVSQLAGADAGIQDPDAALAMGLALRGLVEGR